MINTKRIGYPLGEETWATLYLLNLSMIPPRNGVSSVIMAHFSLVLAPDDLNVWMLILACKGLVQAIGTSKTIGTFPVFLAASIFFPIKISW